MVELRVAVPFDGRHATKSGPYQLNSAHLKRCPSAASHATATRPQPRT